MKPEVLPETKAVLVFHGSPDSPGMVVRSQSVAGLRVFLEEEIPDLGDVLVFSLGKPARAGGWFLILPRRQLPFEPGHEQSLPQLVAAGKGEDCRVIHHGFHESWLVELQNGRISQARILSQDETLDPGPCFLVSPGLPALKVPESWTQGCKLILCPGLLKRLPSLPRLEAARSKAEAWTRCLGEESMPGNSRSENWIPPGPERLSVLKAGAFASAPPPWPGYQGGKGKNRGLVLLALGFFLADLVLGSVLASDLSIPPHGQAILSAPQELAKEGDAALLPGDPGLSGRKTGQDACPAASFLRQFQEALEKQAEPLPALGELKMNSHQIRLKLRLPGGTGMAWFQGFRKEMEGFRLAAFSAVQPGLDLLELEGAVVP